MLRGILNANSFDQALTAVMGTRATVAGNILIAHQDGEAIDLEIIPDDVACLYPDSGIITHSNHFLSFTNRSDLKDIGKSSSPSTLFRANRAWKLLELDRGHIDISSFQQVFRDHFSYPNSICRHVDVKKAKPEQVATLASVIIDMTDPTFYVTKGVPCQNEYYKLQSECLLKD
jgi:isopenicillin-N N-acyltransferase-like protein